MVLHVYHQEISVILSQMLRFEFPSPRVPFANVNPQMKNKQRRNI